MSPTPRTGASGVKAVDPTVDETECLHLWSFPGHRVLCEEAKILHRDISQNNIMVRRDDAGNIFGITIDFDLAVVTEGALSRNSPSSYEITGTLPFMAIDRLLSRDKTHWPRHDLESFFWVIVLFTCRHHEGKTVDNPPFHEWYQCDAELLAKTKSHFLFHFDFANQYHPTPRFKRLLDLWTFPLGEAFSKGLFSRNHTRALTEAVPTAYDYETLDGLITHKKFLAILRVAA